MNWTKTRLTLIGIGIAAERLPAAWQFRIDLREADLRGANLREADLREADLRGADLSGADLREADLSGANLRGANLRGAKLWLADLRGAHLSGANLRGANLREADLREADLSEADLSEANLRGANLRGAAGAFSIGFFGRHHAVAAGGYIAIGCERHTYALWLEQYEKIGRHYDYSDEEIADYGAWIKLAVARQTRIETVEATESAAEPKSEPA